MVHLSLDEGIYKHLSKSNWSGVLSIILNIPGIFLRKNLEKLGNKYHGIFSGNK